MSNTSIRETVLGWCMTGHHRLASGPREGRCPGATTSGHLVCICHCHTGGGGYPDPPQTVDPPTGEDSE